MSRSIILLLTILLGAPALATAQRFSPVAPPVLTGANPNSGQSDVAYNDKQGVYLEVWGHPVVYGRFLTSNGAPIGDGPFVIAQQSQSDAMPRVEYSSGSVDDLFLVRFTSELNGGQYLYVRMVRYTANGPQMGPLQLVMGSGREIARAGGLAFNAARRQFLLTWESPALGWEVFGQLWQVSGAASTPSIAPVTGILNISEMNFAQGTPNVAYDPEHDRYLVVFRGEHPASEFIKGSWARLVAFDANNAMSKSGVIELSSGFGEPAEQNVVYMPEADSYLTFWTDITQVRDLTGRIVDQAGNLSGGTFPILATAGNEGAADAAYSPSVQAILVAAMREQTKYIQGVELSATGGIVDYFQATTAIPDGGLESLFPHVSAGHGGRFGISYVNTYQFVWFELLQHSSGGGGGTPPPPPPAPLPPDCSMTFSSSSESFGSLGGGGAFTLNVGSGCTWTVSSNAGWLTVSASSVSGTGTETVSYTVSANGSNSPRVGILYSGNRSLTVTQAGSGSFRSTDFSGDGRNDLIWQNRMTGELAVWRMNGINLLSADNISPGNIGDSNWKIMGTLDADRDGQTDLLLQHDAGHVAIWRMSRESRVEAVLLGESVVSEPAWRIAGTGDIDRDGNDDVIWQHADGRVGVWYMNGLSIREGAILAVLSDARWRVTGIGDFNSDGHVDILWRHAEWGQLSMWYLNNGTYAANGPMNMVVADLQWRVAGVGDFSGDGKPDLIWQHMGTGDVAAWFLDGGAFVNAWLLNPGRVGNLDWRLAGPR